MDEEQAQAYVGEGQIPPPIPSAPWSRRAFAKHQAMAGAVGVPSSVWEPGAQASHSGSPGAGWYRPAPHGAQEVCPGVACDGPGSHSRQAVEPVASVPYLPGRQPAQSAAPAAATSA